MRGVLGCDIFRISSSMHKPESEEPAVFDGRSPLTAELEVVVTKRERGSEANGRTGRKHASLGNNVII